MSKQLQYTVRNITAGQSDGESITEVAILKQQLEKWIGAKLAGKEREKYSRQRESSTPGVGKLYHRELQVMSVVCLELKGQGKGRFLLLPQLPLWLFLPRTWLNTFIQITYWTPFKVKIITETESYYSLVDFSLHKKKGTFLQSQDLFLSSLLLNICLWVTKAYLCLYFVLFRK